MPPPATPSTKAAVQMALGAVQATFSPPRARHADQHAAQDPQAVDNPQDLTLEAGGVTTAISMLSPMAAKELLPGAKSMTTHQPPELKLEANRPTGPRSLAVSSVATTEDPKLAPIITRLVEGGVLAKDLTKAGCQDRAELDNSHILAVALFCSQLVYLDVGGVFGVTDEAIAAVGERCCHLGHLNVCHLDITDKALIAVALSCPKLQHLDVSFTGVTGSAIAAVALCCHQLQHLNVSHTSHITDLAIVLVAKRCPNLKHLDVTCTSYVKDKAIVAVASHCHRLQHLNVSFTLSITGTAIAAVAKYCPNLKHLDVSGTSAMTDAAIAAVMQHCKHLQQLEVHHHEPRITHKTIEAMVECCPNLQHLNADLPFVTDEMLEELQKNIKASEPGFC